MCASESSTSLPAAAAVPPDTGISHSAGEKLLRQPDPTFHSKSGFSISPCDDGR